MEAGSADGRGLRRLALGAGTPDRRRPGVRAAPRAGALDRCSRRGSTRPPGSRWPCRDWRPRARRSASTWRALAALAAGRRRGHPPTWGETHVVDAGARVRRRTGRAARRCPRCRCPATATACALHRLLPGPSPTSAPRVGRPLRLGPRRPARPAAGWCRRVPTATRRRRTTTTSSPPWAAGGWSPIVTDWDRLTEESR